MDNSGVCTLASIIKNELTDNALVFPIAEAPNTNMLRKFLLGNYVISIDPARAAAIVETRLIDPTETQTVADSVHCLLITLANPMAKFALRGIEKLYIVNTNIKVYGTQSVGIPIKEWLSSMVSYTFDSKNVRTHVDVIYGKSESLQNVRLADVLNRFELVTQDRDIILHSNIVTTQKISSIDRIIDALEAVIESTAMHPASAMTLYDFGCILSPNVQQYTAAEVIKYIFNMLKVKVHYQDNADKSVDALFERLISVLAAPVKIHHKELELEAAQEPMSDTEKLRELIESCRNRNLAKHHKELELEETTAVNEVGDESSDYDIAKVCIAYLDVVGGDLNFSSGEVSINISHLKSHMVLSIATKQDPLLYAALLSVFEPAEILNDVSEYPECFDHLNEDSFKVHPIQLNKTIQLLKHVILTM